MLPVNLLNTLKALALEQKPLPVAASDGIVPKNVHFELGQKLVASVQAQVEPGVFKVLVANQLVQMQLPSSFRSGDTVQLQVVSIQPRLTFSMVNPESPLATADQLGPTARLLSSLSQQPPDKAHILAAKNTPLWAVAEPPQARQLAGLLHDALSNSGLFYESHQALWLEGARSTLQLMQEPQNKLSAQQLQGQTAPQNQATKDIATATSPSMENPAARTASTAGTAPINTAVTDLAQNPGMQNIGMQNSSSQNPSTQNSSLQNSAAQISAPDAGQAQKNLAQAAQQEINTPTSIPEQLRPLVQQQLNALETGQLVWQGNVWPNQPMQWAVHEEGARTPDAEGLKQWVTQIQMDLPNLGSVSATLRFSGTTLRLILDADAAHTRALLGGARTQLVSALSDAGIKVQSAQVSQP